MSDIFSIKKRSEIMSRIKGKDTKPELKIRSLLTASGMRGYRLHWKTVPGRPDIAYPCKKIAIFINGCFWHRCPYCDLPLPKSHKPFWKKKFQKNVERDKRKLSDLRRIGWKTIVLWECEIEKNPKKGIRKIERVYHKQT